MPPYIFNNKKKQTGMINIKETLKVPSAALQAMVDGLRNQSKRRNFKIYMLSYGTEENGICYGCAATCTIQQIAGKNLTAKNINGSESRAQVLGFDWDEFVCFEKIMDSARRGDMCALFNFFGVPYTVLLRHKIDRRFCLHTDEWRHELPKVEKIIEILKSKNL